jgi:hypothetical protein
MATFLDDPPGGSDAVKAALALAARDGVQRFEARFREGGNPPGHQFFYSRVIEAPTLAAARQLAEEWGKRAGDDPFRLERR